MNSDETKRAIDFIIQSQAGAEARMDRADARMDRLDAQMERLVGAVGHLVQVSRDTMRRLDRLESPGS